MIWLHQLHPNSHLVFVDLVLDAPAHVHMCRRRESGGQFGKLCTTTLFPQRGGMVRNNKHLKSRTLELSPLSG